MLTTCTVGQNAAAPRPATTPESKMPLLPANANISTASQLVRDPNRDPLPANKQEADAIKLGYQIFTDTPQYARQYVGGEMSCTNCHLNAGQRDKGLPLVGIAANFPAYSSRNGRLITLEDRIRACFARSENGQAPAYDSKELMAVAAYLTWISQGQAVGQDPPWRHQNVIPKPDQIPADQIDKATGQRLYSQKCAGCHGVDGSGVQLGPSLKPSLWGPNSYNDGAGLAKTQAFAGFIRYAMPYDAPGTLTDKEAQEVAAFVDSQPRPHFEGTASAGC
jgi:thiosulfate dehydrogenase